MNDMDTFIRDIIRSDGFDKNGYFIGAKRLKELALMQRPASSFNDSAWADTMFQCVNNLLATSKDLLSPIKRTAMTNKASQIRVPQELDEWIVMVYADLAFNEAGEFLGWNTFRQALYEKCPHYKRSEWMSQIAKVFHGMNKDYRFCQRPKEWVIPTPQPSTMTIGSDTNFDALDSWIIENAHVAVGAGIGIGEVFRSLKHRLTSLCPVDEWKPLIPSRVNRLQKVRPSPLYRILRPEDHQAEDSQSESQITTDTRPSPVALYLDSAAGIDDWILSAAEYAVATRQPGEFTTHQLIKRHLEATCPRDDWKDIWTTRFNRIRKFERPPRWNQLMKQALSWNQQQKSAVPAQPVIPPDVTNPITKAPVVSQPSANTNTPNVPPVETTAAGDDIAETFPALDQWIISTGWMVGNREAIFPGFDIIEQRIQELCTEERWKPHIHSHVLHLRRNPEFRRAIGAPELPPPTNLYTQHGPTPMTERGSISLNASSTSQSTVIQQDITTEASEKPLSNTPDPVESDRPPADAQDGNTEDLESWILRYIASDGFDEDGQFVGFCRFQNILLCNLPWSYRSEKPAEVIQALRRLQVEGRLPSANNPWKTPLGSAPINPGLVSPSIHDTRSSIASHPESTDHFSGSEPTSLSSPSSMPAHFPGSKSDAEKCDEDPLRTRIYKHLETHGYDVFNRFIGIESFKMSILDSLSWDEGAEMRDAILNTVDTLFRTGRLLCPPSPVPSSYVLSPKSLPSELNCSPHTEQHNETDAASETSSAGADQTFESLIDFDSGGDSTSIDNNPPLPTGISTFLQDMKDPVETNTTTYGSLSDLWDLHRGKSASSLVENDVSVAHIPDEDNRKVVVKNAVERMQVKKKAVEKKNPVPQGIVRPRATATSVSKSSSHFPSLQDHSCLLDFTGVSTNETEVQKAIMFSPGLFDHDSSAENLIPQYGLLGMTQPDQPNTDSGIDPRIYLNTNAPASFFICGLQGSGKSHTTSCILENHLLSNPVLGKLTSPCSAIVLNYNEYTTGTYFRACEAAYLAQPSREPHHPSFAGLSVKDVTVLVPPSNFLRSTTVKTYTSIPNVKVRKLLLQPKDLNTTAMKKLMSVDRKGSPPLYMGLVEKVLRDMGSKTASDNVDYREFKKQIGKLDLDSLQRRPLQQRLDLLEEFLDLESKEGCFDFRPGSLTVVDLSCRHVDEGMACILFDIVVGIYLGDSESQKGKVIAVDEAHKYMTDTPGSKMLTNTLLTVIREQRHHGTRVVISTQEPTIDPRLMDLSSATIIHRFASPKWFDVLRTHISVRGEMSDEVLFERIVNLKVGEALVFAPSAMVEREVISEDYEDEDEDGYGVDGSDAGGASGERVLGTVVQKLGTEVLKVAVRKRFTWDGGRSVFVV